MDNVMEQSEEHKTPETFEGRTEFEQNAELAIGDPKSVGQEYWDKYLEKSEMGDYLTAAYASEDGYLIRTNPHTGKKEMFIAGTHEAHTHKGFKEWMSNVAEGTGEILPDNVFHRYSERKRDEFAHKLIDIAREQDVEVVYGHSRGAAIASEFPEDFTVIGLDGASAIGHHRRYVNLIQSRGPMGTFDNLIGAGHKENVRMKGKGFHNVTQNKAKISAEKKEKKRLDRVAQKARADKKLAAKRAESQKKKMRAAQKRERTEVFKGRDSEPKKKKTWNAVSAKKKKVSRKRTRDSSVYTGLKRKYGGR